MDSSLNRVTLEPLVAVVIEQVPISSRQTTGVHHEATRVEPDDGVYKFVIEQGDFINRPSRIGLEVKGRPGKVEEVRVSGSSVVVAKGVLEFYEKGVVTQP